MHEIGVREAVQIAGFTFNSQTLVMTWISMVVVLFIGWLATRNLRVVPTSNWQMMMETVIEALHDQVEETWARAGVDSCPRSSCRCSCSFSCRIGSV